MEVLLLITVWFLIVLIAFTGIAKQRKSVQEANKMNTKQRMQNAEHLKLLKDDGLISDHDFTVENIDSKMVSIAPAYYANVTIKHMNGEIEVISREAWKKLTKQFGCSNYIILSYHC